MFLKFIILLFLIFPFNVQISMADSFDLDYVGESMTHISRDGDSIVSIAREYGVGYVELRSANPKVDVWMVREGTNVIIPSMHLLPDVENEGIIVNLPEMRLYAFLESGKDPVTFPLGIGRTGLSTPSGSTEIVRKISGPTWTPTKRMREEDPSLPEFMLPGDDNPLGTHMLYFGWPEYGIHGTDKPYGIGRRVSSGCIRMFPEDISQFYHMVPLSTKVKIIDQAIKVGWIGNELYMEAHTEIDQVNLMETQGFVDGYDLSDDQLRLIFSEAGDYINVLNWEKIREVVRERSGVPEIIASSVD